MARPIKEGLSYFPLDCVMDEKIELLESKYGLEGFAIYIKLLQEAYKTQDGTIKYIYNGFSKGKMYGKRWGKLPENVDEIVNFMCEIDLFDMAKYRQHGCLFSNGIKKRVAFIIDARRRDRERKGFPAGKHLENPRKTGEKEKEKEKEIEKINIKQTEQRFDCFYKNFPKKEGKQNAFRHFKATVKNDIDWENFKKATENYLLKIRTEQTELKYIKQASTFVNNWQDWIDYEAPKQPMELL